MKSADPWEFCLLYAFKTSPKRKLIHDIPRECIFSVKVSTVDLIFCSLFANPVEVIHEESFPSSLALSVKSCNVDETLMRDFCLQNNIDKSEKLNTVYNMISECAFNLENVARVKEHVPGASSEHIKKHIQNAFNFKKKTNQKQTIANVMAVVNNQRKYFRSLLSCEKYLFILMLQALDRIMSLFLKESDSNANSESFRNYLINREDHISNGKPLILSELSLSKIFKYSNAKALVNLERKQNVCLMSIIKRIVYPKKRNYITTIWGKSNTGKTTFVDTLTELFGGCSLNLDGRVGDSKFLFEHCSNKYIVKFQDADINNYRFLSCNMAIADGSAVTQNAKYSTDFANRECPPLILTSNPQPPYLDFEKVKDSPINYENRLSVLFSKITLFHFNTEVQKTWDMYGTFDLLCFILYKCLQNCDCNFSDCLICNFRECSIKFGLFTHTLEEKTVKTVTLFSEKYRSSIILKVNSPCVLDSTVKYFEHILGNSPT